MNITTWEIELGEKFVYVFVEMHINIIQSKER